MRSFSHINQVVKSDIVTALVVTALALEYQYSTPSIPQGNLTQH